MILSQESAKYLKELCEQSMKLKLAQKDKMTPDRTVFINLLSGISTCRRCPGIDTNMGYESVYKCEKEENKKLTLKFMKEAYGVDSEDSFKKALGQFSANTDFRDFYNVWNNYPASFIAKLDGDTLEGFNKCKDFAEELSKYTGSKGFLAWDINEQIGLLRRAYACDIIGEKLFNEVADSYWKIAIDYFDSWGEYAISCVCGAAYWEYKYSRFDIKKTESFIKLNTEIAQSLMEKDGCWGRFCWPTTNTEKPAIHPSKMVLMMPDEYRGAYGCIMSKKVYVDGEKVNVAKRQEPNPKYLDVDTGWIIGSGNESNEYLDNPDNMGIVDLNTACNYAPELVDLFMENPNCPALYVRDENGKFVKRQ